MTGTRRVELRATWDVWDVVQQTLFPGDGDEHGVALLCGMAITADTTRLLVREAVPAIDGIDYVPGERGYRHLNGAFVTRQLRKAKDLDLVYLAVHNHGGRGSVGFSGDDLASHERGYPTLLKVSGAPVGGVVVAQGAVAGDIWFPDGGRASLELTTVLGDTISILKPTPPSPSAADLIYDRQAQLFGDVGQAVLRSMSVAIVGAGGVGMMLVELLARLGVGHLIVVDPDTVDLTNLPRLPGTARADATRGARLGPLRSLAARFGWGPSAKVDVALRIARRAQRGIRVDAVRGDVVDEVVARQLVGCDAIFLAADTMLARDVVNQLAYQYLVPTIQVGSKVVVDPSSGEVRDVYAVVRPLGTSPGCLRCNGLIDPQRLAEEALGNDAQVRNQRYVDDPTVTAPSVITLNAMGVGWAAQEFLQFAVGLGRRSDVYKVLRAQPVTPGAPLLTVQEPYADAACHVCGDGAYSARARGDAIELPTRRAPAGSRQS